MNLPSDSHVERLKRCFEELNRLYSDGLRILQDCQGQCSQLTCVEQLIPIMSAVQQVEKEAELSSPAAKELIHSTAVLNQMAANQKPLLEQLLSQVRQIEGEFRSRRSTISQEIDHQSEHQKMRAAYYSKD